MIVFRLAFFGFALLVIQAVADECSDVCFLVPGACSSKGSYCKNGHTCMDLFWFVRDEVLCNHQDEGCSNRPEVSCEEARTIVLEENARGIRSFSNREPRRATLPTRYTGPPSEFVPSGTVHSQQFDNVQFVAITELLRESSRFMAALQEAPEAHSPHWSAIRNAFESGNCLELIDTLDRIILVNDARFDSASYIEVLLWCLKVKSGAFRRVFEMNLTVGCTTCNSFSRSITDSSFRIMVHQSGTLDIGNEIHANLRDRMIHQCNCSEAVYSRPGSFPESFRVSMVNIPSLLMLRFHRTDNPNSRSIAIPSLLNFPSLDPGDPSVTIRYRLVGVVRRIDSGEIRAFLANSSSDMDLSIFGSTGALYERI